MRPNVRVPGMVASLSFVFILIIISVICINLEGFSAKYMFRTMRGFSRVLCPTANALGVTTMCGWEDLVILGSGKTASYV